MDDETLTTTFGDLEDYVDSIPDDGQANPKAQFGNAKAPSFGVPPIPMLEVGLVMACGGHKYGAFNYRDTKISASTYIQAISRHFTKWQDGQDLDEETGAHELAHVAASCLLVIDAINNDMLVDDRSKTGRAGDLMLEFADRFATFKENN